MTADPGATAPNTVPWPPLILLASLAGAALAGVLAPLPVLPAVRAARLCGGAVALSGLSLDLSALRALRRHRATIRPDRPATALVTSGPFALSRNPIYLGNTILLAGIGLLAANAWFWVAAIAALAAVDRLAVRREERHLAAGFGAAWAEYAARVPRWLGRPGRAMR